MMLSVINLHSFYGAELGSSQMPFLMNTSVTAVLVSNSNFIHRALFVISIRKTSRLTS